MVGFIESRIYEGLIINKFLRIGQKVDKIGRKNYREKVPSLNK
ncbi:hypothetical protein CY0110_22869 [Crocosphaera chwakensis CCY0110]|uniref:Uncharacterized protein n=1 Tax=Crocosphaera chwakensis CCY0110 TaxID=391612 RepID=A3IX80_9CHRO|nr:hypothetical protein CY0110_22869 [Crocosphaera chwakensis CCY0110]